MRLSGGQRHTGPRYGHELNTATMGSPTSPAANAAGVVDGVYTSYIPAAVGLNRPKQE